MTSPVDIGRDTPLRLDEAVRRAFPAGGMTRQETLTSEASSMSGPTTCEATLNATSSPALADGAMPCGSQDGPMIANVGPAPVPVSRFRAREGARGTPTIDTCGPLFTASSPTARLQSSLESKLRARTDVNGSPEYALTWKTWDMPAGLPICALRGSARHILGSGCIGWPTLIKRDGATLLRARRTPNATGSEPMAWVGGLVTGLVTENRAGLQMEVSVGLNPAWASWSMGFPAEWPQLAPLATPSSRKSQRNSSSRRKKQLEPQHDES